MVDEQALRAKIRERRYSYTFIAEVLGVSKATLENKLTNKTQFKVTEVKMLKNMLHLTGPEVDSIFFAD